MTQVSVQVGLAYRSGIPEDVAVNTWSFNTGGLGQDPIAIGVIAEAIEDFYIGVGPYLSPVLSGNIAIKMYDIEEPLPRVPFYEDLNAASMVTGTTPVPEEVALCLSFNGTPTSGIPQARRRGRVYLGPLSSTSVTDDAQERTRPTANVVTEVRAQYASLRALVDGAGVTHAIWSRANSNFVPVVGAHVDDAFDTQRRRGVRPTTRFPIWPTP